MSVCVCVCVCMLLLLRVHCVHAEGPRRLTLHLPSLSLSHATSVYLPLLSQNRSEMSDAFKSAVKNSRAETKRAMRSLGSEAPLSESSQLLLEVEANHAVDHEEEYAYSTGDLLSSSIRMIFKKPIFF